MASLAFGLGTMTKKRVIMKDVAQKAGVHQTTVSLALRNDPRIPETTRQRIQQIAKELGYVPDPLLSSLVAYRRTSQVPLKRETIALILDVKQSQRFEEGDYLPTVVKTIIERSRELGYQVERFQRGRDYDSVRSLERVLHARNIHALLFGDVDNADLSYKLDWNQYSMVKITQAPQSVPIDSVMGNYFFSARTVMRKLKEAGVKRPALAVSTAEESHTRNLSRAGFEYGQRRHFAPEHHIPVFEFERKPVEQMNEEVYAWIAKEKPDVLLSYWNNLAIPARRLTLEGHYCRFVCLEADEESVQYGGIRNNFRKMAETAVELLISKMKLNQRGLPETPTLTLVEEKWFELGQWP